MVERIDADHLSEILKAASDPTRRAILTMLAQHGPLRVGDIHAQFSLSLNAVSKHIKVLEAGGLVVRRTEWREHLIEVNMAPLATIDDWFASLRSIWDLRLEALDTIITQGATEMTDLTLTTERTIKAPQEAVFKAWLDPEMLRKFMRPGPGMTTPKAETDPKEGGRFDLVMMAGEDEIPHAGTYKVIDPHNKIVFTWESPFSADDSTVTLNFAAADSGTRVTLTHVRFVSEESRDNHEGGWAKILEALDETLG